jgi:hypothetical protein
LDGNGLGRGEVAQVQQGAGAVAGMTRAITGKPFCDCTGTFRTKAIKLTISKPPQKRSPNRQPVAL